MASFQNISPEMKFQLSFIPTTDAENGYNYRFKRGTPACTKHFAGQSHGEQAPLNQTTFLHGFSISLGEGIWRKVFGDVTISEITDFKMRNSQSVMMSFDFFSWLFSFFGGGGATGGKDKITISDFSPTCEVSVHETVQEESLKRHSETVHPGRSINSFLLYEVVLSIGIFNLP
jgi:hypothetical protein